MLVQLFYLRQLLSDDMAHYDHYVSLYPHCISYWSVTGYRKCNENGLSRILQTQSL